MVNQAEIFAPNGTVVKSDNSIHSSLGLTSSYFFRKPPEIRLQDDTIMVKYISFIAKPRIS